jgi:predicted lipid-binding transport protein (Tim44 family)
MIVTAFAEGNRAVLRNLLAPEVFESFASALGEREKRGEKVTTTFVSIDKVMIDDAGLNRRTAEIKIHFTAQMITATRDQGGTVIDGSPDKVVQIDDIWTFARDTGSRDPNWKLAATETAQ